MNVTIHHSFLPHNDPEASLAFYRDTLGLEVRNDVGYQGMRWITLGAPDQPDTSIVLYPPAATPGLTEDERRAVTEMMAKGTYASLVLATEDVDGTEAHKLKVTLKNGDVEYVFLDPDHFLEIRMVAQRSVRGTLVESVTDYGDYEEVAGVFFPFSISTENKADGGRTQTTIEHAEANVAIDDSLFAFPAAKTGAGK